MKKNDKSIKNVVRGTKNFTADEILKYLEDSGKVDLSDVQDAIEMKERQELLRRHPYKITQGKDGYWRTYVKDGSKESGYRLIKKSTRKKLDDILVEYYKTETDKTITLDEMYWRWRKVQDCMVVDNTVYKYTTDYNRFFKDKAFMQNPIEEITVDMLKLFFHDMIVDNGLSKGSFKKAYGYIDNTFQKAFREKVIPENPMVYLLRKQFYGYCEEIDKPLSKQVYTDEEVELITQWLHQQYKKIPSYIPHYAVELASLTGMRVGEIVALKWEDIHNEKGYFTIQRSEKFNRKTKEYFIDKTKNKKVRNFPLDEKITTLFTRVKKAEFAKGYLCEWIFANEEGRIHAPVVSSCIKNKCKQLRIPDRGIHAFRKTFNSNMRCAGVSEVVAASLLGHSPDVNKNYYTFDTTSLEDKAKIVADAHAHFG